MAARLKREDEVMVIRGRDKGRRGKIQRVFPDKDQILVEGVNMVKRHYKCPGTAGGDCRQRNAPCCFQSNAGLPIVR
jgi:large subunit ribosomal protein L24